MRHLLVLCLALTPVTAQGQDPVSLYPNNYTVLLENERVRVMDFRLRRGDTERLHRHPAHVLYVLEPFRIEFTLADGRKAMRETKAGEILFSEAVTHSPVNVGQTDAHGILIELKGVGAAAADAPTDVLTAFTFIKGIPGRGSDLERELLALTVPTRAEPGNLAYDLYQSRTRPNEFVRFEVWRDSAALEAHKATPHLKASFEKRQTQGWTTDITLWRRVEP
jgi:quinol monooxygenase YgiN/quercetin dioxygenase-like cupin family protein